MYFTAAFATMTLLMMMCFRSGQEKLLGLYQRIDVSYSNKKLPSHDVRLSALKMAFFIVMVFVELLFYVTKVWLLAVHQRQSYNY